MTKSIKVGVRFGFFGEKNMYECVEPPTSSGPTVKCRALRGNGKKFGQVVEFDVDKIDFIQGELFL